MVRSFHGRKNKLGTYCPPLAVFLDTGFLRTLPQRHLSNGSAEILKMACIKDVDLFELLEEYSADLLATGFQVRQLAPWPLSTWDNDSTQHTTYRKSWPPRCLSNVAHTHCWAPTHYCHCAHTVGLPSVWHVCWAIRVLCLNTMRSTTC